MPFRILSRPTSMRRARVSSFLADVTQHLHSLRASGVMLAHKFLTIASDSMALRKSTGNLCLLPEAGGCRAIVPGVYRALTVSQIRHRRALGQVREYVAVAELRQREAAAVICPPWAASRPAVPGRPSPVGHQRSLAPGAHLLSASHRRRRNGRVARVVD